jgi:lipid-A-disaccharide synthase-like uncharacterized protein
MLLNIFEVIGYLGLLILIFSYVIINTRHRKYFWFIDSIATLFLLTYSFYVGDWIFIITNFLILVMLIIRQLKMKEVIQNE